MEKRKVYRCKRKRVGQSGYMEIRLPEHHRARGNGYVYEHIVVMEQKLGREIRREDGHVHHIDHNRQNNSPDNLELLPAHVHYALHGKRRRGKGLSKASIKNGCFTEPKRKKSDEIKIVPKSKLPRGHYFVRGIGIAEK